MLGQFLLSVLVLSTFSFEAQAIPKCPAKLDAPAMTQSRIQIEQNSVTWNGQKVPSFTADRLVNELELLKFLVDNPNHVFSSREIIRQVFPSRKNDPLSAQEMFVKKLKFKIMDALKDFPDFNALQNVRGLGYLLVDPSAVVEEVGNVRVTLDAVYWNHLLVPGFGPDELVRRRALLHLLDQVDQYVSVREFTDDVLDNPPASDAERLSQALNIFREIQKSFLLVDADFRALDYKTNVGFAWSEIYPKIRRRAKPEPSMYFRGRNIKLERGARLVLEALLEKAPDPVSHAEIALALPGERVSSALIRVYISYIRAQVGPDCIATKPGHYWWTASDKPELKPQRRVEQSDNP